MTSMRRVSRKKSAQYLTDHGYEISHNTLQKLACVGGGPEYEKWGNRCLYLPEKLIEWAESRLKPCRNTNDLDKTVAS